MAMASGPARRPRPRLRAGNGETRRRRIPASMTYRALGYAAPVSPATLNDDYERRPYWHATMPDLPDRRGRPLPDAADVVVVGGGYTGITAARELARRGASVTLLEAETLGFGGSTRNGGIVHPGYKWGPRALVKRYGEETGKALFRDTLDAYALVKRLIADESIDCELRECGSLDLAWGANHVDDLVEAGRTLADFGVESTFVPRERLREEIGSDAYHGGLAAPAGRPAPPRQVLRRARGRRGHGRRGPPRGRPGDGRPAPGRRPASSSRPTAARSSRRTSSSGRTATRTASCRRFAAGSSRSGATSSRPSHSPRSWHGSSRRRAGRSSTRRTSSTTGTCRRTAG